MNTSSRAALFSALFALTAAASAGPLDPPPGPVSPTHKTLTQVEPRTPISAQTTPGTGSATYAITQPGSYYLTGSLVGEAGKHGIVIQASNVTIDLRGFHVVGVPGAQAGITVASSPGDPHSFITISNGVISHWPHGGFQTSASVGTALRHLRAHANGGSGFTTGVSSILVECVAAENALFGFSSFGGSTYNNCVSDGNGANGYYIGSGSALTACTASRNAGNGFRVGPGSTLSACVAESNGGDGFELHHGSALFDCIARANTGRGFTSGASVSLSRSTAAENGASGVEFGADSRITDCLLRANGGFGAKAAARSLIAGNSCIANGTAGGVGGGIEVTGQGSRIENNQLNSNTNIGLRVTTNRNLILRNSAILNTSHWDIAAGNQVGPFTSDPATAGPWANFQH